MEALKTGKVATEKKAKKVVAMWKKWGFEAWYEFNPKGFYFTYIKIS